MSAARPVPTRPRGGARRASAYVLILATCLLVTVIGIAALLAVRVQHRTAAADEGVARARLNAWSGLNLALLSLHEDPSWRQTSTNNAWAPQVVLPDGTCSWRLVDKVDGNLADDPFDPVWVEARGVAGGATQKTSVKLMARRDALEALTTCIHSAQRLRIDTDAGLRVLGAPASTNADADVDGTLYGDVEAGAVTGNGWITGAAEVPAAAKAAPAATVVASYMAAATPIPFNGDLDGIVLAPGVNEYGGGLDPDGVYFISTAGNVLRMRNTRIHGTLVVDAGSGTVSVEGQVLLHNYRADHPVLIVKGNLVIQHASAGDASMRVLSETAIGHNFNPPGAPYEGGADLDEGDDYPSVIRGLVHVTGNLDLLNQPRIVGTVICQSSVDVQGLAEIVYDPAIADDPPQGYAAPGPVQPADGTWRRVVD